MTYYSKSECLRLRQTLQAYFTTNFPETENVSITVVRDQVLTNLNQFYDLCVQIENLTKDEDEAKYTLWVSVKDCEEKCRDIKKEVKRLKARHKGLDYANNFKVDGKYDHLRSVTAQVSWRNTLEHFMRSAVQFSERGKPVPPSARAHIAQGIIQTFDTARQSLLDIQAKLVVLREERNAFREAIQPSIAMVRAALRNYFNSKGSLVIAQQLRKAGFKKQLSQDPSDSKGDGADPIEPTTTEPEPTTGAETSVEALTLPTNQDSRASTKGVTNLAAVRDVLKDVINRITIPK